MQSLAAVIGEAAVCSLLIDLGGLSFDIQHNPERLPQPIRSRLSPCEARRLAAACGGTNLYIPRVAQKRARAALIGKRFDALLKEGETARRAAKRIALEFETSERTVWTALKMPIENEIQPPTHEAQRGFEF